MAKDPRFDTPDIERLFRALIPSGSPDPFGKLEEMLLSLAEEHSKDGILTDKFREEVKSELDSIKSRTFGILFLQIFKTIKLFMGFLPQGRIILIVIAAIGLLTALLQDGTVSGASIREAVAKTGLAKFIDKLLADLTTFVEGIAVHVEELANVTSEVFVSIAGSLDEAEVEVRDIIAQLTPIGGETEEEQGLRIALARDKALSIQRRLLPAGNAASNGADLVGPALRGLDDRIRTIPNMALKLVRL